LYWTEYPLCKNKLRTPAALDIRFYPVSAPELLDMRARFQRGRLDLKIEGTHLSLQTYRRFLTENHESIRAFNKQPSTRNTSIGVVWTRLRLRPRARAVEVGGGALIAAGHEAITASVTGNVWQVSTTVGQKLQAGEVLLVLEAMKMEIPVCTDVAGEVTEIRCERGSAVRAGEVLVVINPAPCA